MSGQDDWDDPDDFIADEWISLLGAVDLVASATTIGYIAAKTDILEMVADGRIDLRCQKVREEADIGELSWGLLDKLKMHPRQKSRGFKFKCHHLNEPMPMSSRFWSGTDGWRIDPAKVDWKVGMIIGVKPADLLESFTADSSLLLTRRAATGIVVRISSMQALLPKGGVHELRKPKKLSTPASILDRKKHGRSRPRIKEYKQGPVLAHLEEDILNGKISRFGKVTDRGVRAKLICYLIAALTTQNGRVPSHSTGGRLADYIMKIWQQYPEPSEPIEPFAEPKEATLAKS